MWHRRTCREAAHRDLGGGGSLGGRAPPAWSSWRPATTGATTPPAARTRRRACRSTRRPRRRRRRHRRATRRPAPWPSACPDHLRRRPRPARPGWRGGRVPGRGGRRRAGRGARPGPGCRRRTDRGRGLVDRPRRRHGRHHLRPAGSWSAMPVSTQTATQVFPPDPTTTTPTGSGGDTPTSSGGGAGGAEPPEPGADGTPRHGRVHHRTVRPAPERRARPGRRPTRAGARAQAAGRAGHRRAVPGRPRRRLVRHPGLRPGPAVDCAPVADDPPAAGVPHDRARRPLRTPSWRPRPATWSPSCSRPPASTRRPPRSWRRRAPPRCR